MIGISSKLYFILPIIFFLLSCANPDQKMSKLKNASGINVLKGEFVIVPKGGFVVLNTKTRHLLGEVFVLMENCRKNKVCIADFKGTVERSER